MKISQIILTTLVLSIGLQTSARAENWPSTLTLGPTQFFSWAGFVQATEVKAGQDYTPPPSPAPDITEKIDYDARWKVKYLPEHTLFADSPTSYPVAFFLLGKFFKKSVRMFVVENGESREIMYSPNYFSMPANSPARGLPPNAGFSGFQIKASKKQSDWFDHDWVAFQGASYFRSSGELDQYGLSARGVAINTTAGGPEEFPDFTEFYFQEGASADDPVTVYARLDSPSLTGAYKFKIEKNKGVIMDVEAHLFTRKFIQQLGIAPLTSMFWFSESNKKAGIVDWRPEVHDSDGLSLWTGNGERLWRPLNNPPRVMTNSFVDENPRGFGLLQRDRNIENYLDGVSYERRPSLWVEPVGNWGRGSVQLVELPTDDETADNIVAMWVPEKPVDSHQSLSFHYRLHWLADEPYPATQFAHVIGTRHGRGGDPGTSRPQGVHKIVVEWAGGDLTSRNEKTKPQVDLTTSRGKLSKLWIERLPFSDHWQVLFDLDVEGNEPVDLRMSLHDAGRPLSEVWLGQFHPQQ